MRMQADEQERKAMSGSSGVTVLNPFVPMFNSNSIHAFTNLVPQHISIMKNDGYGDKRVCLEAAYGKNMVVKYFLTPNLVSFNGRPTQLLWYLSIVFTKNVKRFASLEELEKNRVIELDIKQLANLFDVKIQKMRNIVTRSIMTLREMEWQFTEAIPGYEDDPVDWVFSVIDGRGVSKKGRILVKLSMDFARYLSVIYITYIPLSVLKIKPKNNPYSLRFADKLLNNFNLNYNSKRRNYVTVVELLSLVPEIPKYADIAGKGQINQRIIGPFMRDIDVLVTLAVISVWYFVDDYNNPFDMDLNKISYNNFIRLKVFYDIFDWPAAEKQKNEEKEDEKKELCHDILEPCHDILELCHDI